MTISILTVTTLFPNDVQRQHGIFVATRLEKLVATNLVSAHVLAPVPWLPRFVDYSAYGPLYRVPQRTERDGIMVEHPRYLVLPKIGMVLTPHTLYRAMRRRFLKLIRDGHRFDLIDAHYFYPDGVAAVRLAREFGLPVTVTARGTDLNLIPRFKLPRRMIRAAAQCADGLITVCQALKDELVALGVPEKRVVVLRNGVDLALFRPLDRDRLRLEFGFTRRTLLSVGHLVARKGHDLAIRALPRLPETNLVVVGDGPERTPLETLAADMGLKERVRFFGAVDQRRLCEIYNAADALVLASSREGWANVLLESMACGTPVVASSVWGTPEVVSAPEAGVLMSSLDVEGVVSGVERLFRTLPDRGATRRYAERFDWQPTTQGQLDLFRTILSARQTNSAEKFEVAFEH